MSFDAEYLGSYPAMQGGRRVGFHLETKVLRKDWRLNWNMVLEAGGWLIGDEVRLEVAPEAFEV